MGDFSNFAAFSQYLKFNKMFQCVMFIQQGRRKKLGVCSTWFPFLCYNTMAHLPLLPVWHSRDRISIWNFINNFFFEFNECFKLIQRPKHMGSCGYSIDKIRRTQNEHLIIVCQNVIDLYSVVVNLNQIS